MADTEVAFVPDRLVLSIYHDEVVEQLGVGPESLYAELFWLPLIGPTSYLLWRRLNLRLQMGDDLEPGREPHVALEVLATEMGVRHNDARSAPIRRTIERLADFDFIHRNAENVAVRTHVDRLTSARVRRLPPGLAALHSLDLFR